MKKKMINTQISNFKTYNMYFREMLTLAENVFEFKNLPEFIDVAYLNKQLLRKGAVAFFMEKDLGLIALPYNIVGTLDVYGRPNGIEVFGDNNFHRVLNRDEYVLMFDNNGRYPLYLDICQMAERIALCVRTEDVNILHQRTPRVWKTSKDTEKSLKDTINEIDSMQENVVTYQSLAVEDMNAVLAPAPYVTDKIDQHLRELWAEFYRLIGVANLQEQKKERVIVDEMSASQGGTIASRFSRFEPRKRAIEEINKKWNLDLEVSYYDGEPTTEKGEEDVSDDSGLSDDSEPDETSRME